MISGPGTVRWYDFEGGFFAIRGADGVTYDPMNLSAEYEQDGLPVRFRACFRGAAGDAAPAAAELTHRPASPFRPDDCAPRSRVPG